MPDFSTPVGSNQPYIPVIKRDQSARMVGTIKVAESHAALQALVDRERQNVGLGLPVWGRWERLQVLTELPGIERRWTLGTGNNAAAESHARMVVIGIRTFLLDNDSNIVRSTEGAPGTEIGLNGDLALDIALGVVYRKAAGNWSVEATLGGGGGSGSGMTPIPFSSTVPLDGNKVMARTQISAAVALTLGAKVAGGSCRIPFLSNGANVPTITGAAEWANSFGFDNSATGLLNVLDMWTDDGTNAYYSWSQPVTQTGGSDTTPPTLTSASVANSAPSVVALAFSETMDTSSTPAAGAFTVSGHTISSLAWVGGVLNLVVTPAFANGEAPRTLAYTLPGTNPLRDLAGNPLASLSNRAITNNVQPVDTTAPVLGTPTISGATVTLPYNESLNTTAPAASAFSVSIAGAAQTPTGVAVTGQNIVLTLATAATAGQSVTATYTVPGTNPIRDTAGNSAAAFTAVAVTNNTGSDDFADWQARMATVGGSASQVELDAVQTFINTAKNGATPFWDCILRANAFVNNAAASLVPFKIQGGSTNDTSPASTSVNAGGRGQSTGTGYVNTQTPPPFPLGGLSVYLRDLQSFSPAATNVIIGARDSTSTQCYRIAANLDASGSAVGYIQGAYGGAGSEQVAANTGAAMNVGHWHVQRTSATSSKLRRNGALIGPENTANITAAELTQPLYVHANNGGGTAGAFTKNPTSIGFYAILAGAMTDAQVTAYNTAVVAMMTAMGRNL